MSLLPYAVAAWLLIIGLYGIVTSQNLVHLVLCLSVLQSSTYLLILEIGYRTRTTAPVFADIPVRTRVVDPVVQALVLTDIVVAVTIAAVLLSLAVQVHRRSGTLDPDQLRALRG
jgi:multicomponent Na+:H+ antiporter subunit C